ncbi:TBC1 domain family member 31 isoform X2 [Ischnura elegans]|uniref:TBC1 domain family member 31 isoform X2 n=1 Tax=Ischnura elegans TaxID=197161 RepID=UPI001ED8772E|nr:TBC1 domain family member 31 isoform X2 [Ischnura elegans]
MAVNLKYCPISQGIKKYSFCRKRQRSDGLLVQVHHTAVGSRNPARFVLGAFHENGNVLAVVDANGNIFLVDVRNNKFWSLPNSGECTAITFSSFDENEVILASSECFVRVINFENGKESTCLKGHAVPPTQLSCGGAQEKMLLSVAISHHNHGDRKDASEAILWDLRTYTRAHSLNIHSDCGIRQAKFLSGISSETIIAMFDDDSICCWDLQDLACAKMISQPAEEHSYLKTISCTKNGRAVLVGGKSHLLVAFSMETFVPMKVIELPDEMCGVKELEFLPEPFDGGSNHVLGILSYDGQVYFLDLNTSTFIGKIKTEKSQIYKFFCSSSGCYVACILRTGEMSIYNGSQILADKKPSKVKVSVDKNAQQPVTTCGRITNEERHSTGAERKLLMDGTCRNQPVSIKNSAKMKEVKSELNHKRLRLLLRHHGAFPVRYRTLAWRTVFLQLPYNQKAFSGLASRGTHPAYFNLELKYPLENRSELKILKKVVSCLAHWSPLFSQVDYLPLFVYPFIKLFIHDILGCFEAVATILFNFCQHWFEFFPFPPINVLAAIENLLSYHDPSLLAFFVRKGVNTKVYAWPLLQVAFSEVLSNDEWLQFWDHVLVNEPSFLLAAIPAYCIISRTALLRCSNMDDFQLFFRNQNPLDMEKFISKVYFICGNTPTDFHPRQHLHLFQPLPKGDTYPVFSQYPKLLVDTNVDKLKRIQLEEKAILSQEVKLLKELQEREEQRVHAENAILKQKYLNELEKAYKYAVKIEEDKVSRRYNDLLNLKKDVMNASLDENVERLESEGKNHVLSDCCLGGNPKNEEMILW